MSNVTRRASNLVIPIRALNTRGNEVTLWTTTTDDDVYVFDSLDLHHRYTVHNNNRGVFRPGFPTSNNSQYSRIHLHPRSPPVFRVNPATQDSIENLERFRIEGATESECSICLGVLALGSEAIRMPRPCSHVYHHHCIIKWLNMNNSCPLCRRTI